MDINIKDRYLNITVSFEQIQKAFETICPDAHTNADGNAEDLILLSYHQCPEIEEDKTFIESQALLKHLEMAQYNGNIHSDIPFSLQDEYIAFLNQRTVENEIDEKLKTKYDVPKKRIE
jgi:hypothetical protein